MLSGSGLSRREAPASPTIVTTASSAVTLGTTAPTLSDSAVVSGGYRETGNLIFTLTGPGGFSYTQTDTLTGNGTYTASDTLPTTGTVAGTYTWSVTYAGDANNKSAVDQGGSAEKTVVCPACPTIVTTASSAVALGTTAPTLSDSAVVSGGYFETGSLVFTLTGPGGFSYTQTDTLSGNGAYAASDTLPTTGTVAGTYTWSVTYAGDANNYCAVDQGGSAEKKVVCPACPTIVTTASSAVALGTTAPTLSDSAVVSGGYFETGSLIFTLTGPGGFSYTQTDTLSGNGTYTASDTLPTTGTVAGTYTWSVTYAGDANNYCAVDQGGSAEQTVVCPACPTIVTTASSAVALGTTAPTLSDSAVVSGGYFETGSLVFTLTGPGGFSYTQTDTLNGNGTYAASDTLPTTGTVAGTYTWSVTYAGDANNYCAVDQGGSAEQTVVCPACPTIVTTASSAVTLGTTAPTLSDSAVVSGGYFETGSLVFTLTGPGGFSYTQTDTLSGNGTYTASATLPTTGNVAGTYTWSVTYAGDANNYCAVDQGGSPEQTVVSPASPTIVTTASSAVTLSPPAPTLSDSAVVSGGYFETGSLIFTLTGPNGFSYTQTDTLSGNCTYTASDTLPTTGTVAGTYTWSVTYAGDANNNSAVDQGGSAEKTVVSPASPSILTTASPTTSLGPPAPTLSDSAVVSGGYSETGSLVFTLTGPSGFSYTQTDTLSGNGTYTASDTLPATAVAGFYTWSVHYAGDANNNSAVDQGSTAEQTEVTPAVGSPDSPTIVTTASSAVTLGTTAPTLSDSAVVSGGNNETGSLIFTLTGPGGFSYTQTDTLTGNGTYTASDTLPTTGTVAGTYTWSVTYAGDANNNSAVDQGGSAEQTVVSPASPTIVTTASSAVTLGPPAPTLSDSAVVSGGYFETGSLVFTLTGPSGFSYTQTDTLSGNGTYTASDTLPSTAAAGIYTWSVHYAGDANNNSAVDQGGSAEQTEVTPAVGSPASPTNLIVVATDKSPTAPEVVEVINAETGAVVTSFVPYESTFLGGIRVATADMTGNGQEDIIVAPGRGRAPQIRVFTEAGVELTAYRTMAYDPSYLGGVQLAVADVNGDGLPDIITVPSQGPAEVKVFLNTGNPADPIDQTPYRDFLAFPSTFIGGSTLAAADMGSIVGGNFTNTLDGKAEIVVANGPASMTATVEVFDVSGTPTLVQSFTPFANTLPGFTGGEFLSVGNVDSSGIPDIVVGAGSDGGSNVEVWGWNTSNATLSRLGGFVAFTDAGNSAPLHLATLDSNDGPLDNEIVAVEGEGGTAGEIHIFDITSASPLQVQEITPLTGFPGPLFVATIPGLAVAAASADPGSADPPPDTVGLFDSATATFLLRDTNTTGTADTTFDFGQPGAGEVGLSGDWTGDGTTTVGLFDPQTSTFYLRNSNSTGVADITVGFGNPALSSTGQYVPLVGDWTGDGVDSVGFYDRQTATWYLRNSNTTGVADITFGFGVPGSNWVPIVGDWNGNGTTTVGLYDPQNAVFYLRNSNSTGVADITFGFGVPGSPCLPVEGDWTGNDTTTVGLYDPQDAQFYLRNSNSTGTADGTFGFGAPGAAVMPISGNWLGALPQFAAGGAITPPAGTAPLTNAELQPIVAAAIGRFANAGLPPAAIDAMAQARVSVGDIASGGMLGETFGSTVIIDRYADGYGWFVDSTPAKNQAYGPATGTQMSAIDPQAVDHIDLLTVVEHELGHVVGLSDLPSSSQDVMSAQLGVGIRRTVSPADIDAVLAGGHY
jgi:hypothetical protein